MKIKQLIKENLRKELLKLEEEILKSFITFFKASPKFKLNKSITNLKQFPDVYPKSLNKYSPLFDLNILKLGFASSLKGELYIFLGSNGKYF